MTNVRFSSVWRMDGSGRPLQDVATKLLGSFPMQVARFIGHPSGQLPFQIEVDKRSMTPSGHVHGDVFLFIGDHTHEALRLLRKQHIEGKLSEVEYKHGLNALRGSAHVVDPFHRIAKMASHKYREIKVIVRRIMRGRRPIPKIS